MRNKRPARRNIGIEVDGQVVARWRRQDVAPFCEIVQSDAVEFLRAFPFDGGELVYSDPPYLPETRKRPRVYRHDYDIDQHVELLAAVASLPCAVILSGYDSARYDKALLGWRKVNFRSKTQAGPTTETVWLNFPEPDELHDLRYLGRDFREREAIRRRRASLLSRIKRMSPMERLAMLESLSRRHGPEIAYALERAS